MNIVLELFRLQQVDRQIDRARSQLNAIQKTLENDSELKQALNKVEAAQTENHRAWHEMKTAEAAVQAQKIKIEQTESSLYSGNVKNPKELQDLQMESASLKKHLATLEERELEAMITAESANAAYQSAKNALELLQAKRGHEHKKLIEDKEALIKHIKSLEDEREASLAPMDSNILQSYEDLRKHKRGIAVSEIEDNACAACGTDIHPATQQNARKQIVHCPSCGRILFAK